MVTWHSRRAAAQPPAGLTVNRFRAGDSELAILSFPVSLDRQLTSTEHEIVEGLLKGKRTAEIARERGTSQRTVANQIASIYYKLGVRSRWELVAHAALLGGSALRP